MMKHFALTFGLVAVATTCGSSAEPTAGDYMKHWKPLVGTWECILKTEGETVSGSFSFRPSRNKACYLSYAAIPGNPSVQGIQGLDPKTKRWTVAEFGEDGSFGKLVFEIDSVQGGLGVGSEFQTENKKTMSDGTTKTESNAWRCKSCTKQRIEFSVTEQIEDGEERPSMTVVMERVKRSDGKAKKKP